MPSLPGQAAYLKENTVSSPNTPPSTPEGGAQLLPEIEAYIKEHSIQATLQELVAELAEKLPEDPVTFMVGFLQSKEVRFMLPYSALGSVCSLYHG